MVHVQGIKTEMRSGLDVCVCQSRGLLTVALKPIYFTPNEERLI